MTALAYSPPINFQDLIRETHTSRSGIDLQLYEALAEFLPELEYGYGGEVLRTPIHEALGWKFTRFGHQAHKPLEAFVFRNEDGSIWQLILNKPDPNGRPYSYMAPKGAGNRAYLPPVPIEEIRHRIAAQAGGSVALDGSFWQWLAQHPEVPLVITEGGKKALALLSLEIPAISVYGCDCLKSPDLLPFLKGREVILALDQDAKTTTRRRVRRAILRGGRHLQGQGARVSVATWEPEQGKGIDDLLVQSGRRAVEQAIGKASPLALWRARSQGRAQVHATSTVNVPDLSGLAPELLPQSGVIGIFSPKGTGKTKLAAKATAASDRLLLLTHRISLETNLAARFRATRRAEADRSQGRWISGGEITHRLTSCFDSLLAFDPSEFSGCDLVLDEANEGLRHLISGSTCGRGGQRNQRLERFEALIQGAKRVILMGADLTQREIDYICQLRGEGEKGWTLLNRYRPTEAQVEWLECSDPTAVLSRIRETAQEGKHLIIPTDSKRLAQQTEAILIPILGEDAILRICADTSGGETAQSFIANPDGYLADHPELRAVIYSPSISSGVSIESDWPDLVVGIFRACSVTHTDAAQALARVRAPVPRIVWAAVRGPGDLDNPLQRRQRQHRLATFTAGLIGDPRAVEQVDWLSPHLELWSQYQADRGRSLENFRANLRAHLEESGHSLTIREAATVPEIREALREAQQQIREREALATCEARKLTPDEAASLEAAVSLDPDEQRALNRYRIEQFYRSEVSIDLVLFDRDGRSRGELSLLERLLHPELALDRDRGRVNQLAQGKQITPWDLIHSTAEREALKRIGFIELLNHALEGGEWHSDDPMVVAVAEKARLHREGMKDLNFTVSREVGNTQIVGELFRRLHLKTLSRRHRQADPPPQIRGSEQGGGSRLIRLYKLDPDHLKQVQSILSRRQEARSQMHLHTHQSKLTTGGPHEQEESLPQEKTPSGTEGRSGLSPSSGVPGIHQRASERSEGGDTSITRGDRSEMGEISRAGQTASSTPLHPRIRQAMRIIKQGLATPGEIVERFGIPLDHLGLG